MSELVVGRRVMATGTQDGFKPEGFGTVVDNDHLSLEVEWDIPHPHMECNRADGKIWYMSRENVQAVLEDNV